MNKTNIYITNLAFNNAVKDIDEILKKDKKFKIICDKKANTLGKLEKEKEIFFKNETSNDMDTIIICLNENIYYDNINDIVLIAYKYDNNFIFKAYKGKIK